MSVIDLMEQWSKEPVAVTLKVVLVLCVPSIGCVKGCFPKDSSFQRRLYLGQSYHTNSNVVTGCQVPVFLLPVATLALVTPGRFGNFGCQLLVLVVLYQMGFGHEPVLALARQVAVDNVVALAVGHDVPQAVCPHDQVLVATSCQLAQLVSLDVRLAAEKLFAVDARALDDETVVTDPPGHTHSGHQPAQFASARNDGL